jgi:hypothetical protein
VVRSLHCVTDSRIECAHHIAACASRTFRQLRRFHLLRLESRPTTASPFAPTTILPLMESTATRGSSSCLRSSTSSSTPRETGKQTLLVIDARCLTRISSTAALNVKAASHALTAHMDRDFFPAGLEPRLSQFNWPGDPMAVLRRSCAAAAQIVHPELLDPALYARLLALQALYR